MKVIRKRLLTPPADAITLADAKRSLVVLHGDDDLLIGRLIKAATAKAERDCDRAFGPQTWELVLDAFPAGEIEVPYGPLASVTSITYLDSALSAQTLGAELYSIEEGHPLGLIVSTGSWPAAGASRNAVVVRYVAGTGWPEDVLHAVHLLVGHWYLHREAVGAPNESAAMPLAYESLIERHRRMFA